MPDKKATLIALEIHRRKLAKLVGDLLSKADEIDQDSKFGTLKLPKPASEKLAEACRELSLLSETIDQIDVVIKKGRVPEAEDALVRALNIATHLSNKLNEIKRSK